MLSTTKNGMLLIAEEMEKMKESMTKIVRTIGAIIGAEDATGQYIDEKESEFFQSTGKTERGGVDNGQTRV